MEEGKEAICLDQEIDFCTLGMFIIDEIHYLPPKPPVFDILGGAGAYSALGARIFSPSPLSKTVSWIVDQGSDFPPSIADQISSWDTSCLLRTDHSRLTTRGWNGFDAHENRAFKYTTPKLRLDENSLTPAFLFSKSFHLCCSPARCIELTTSILRKRKQKNPSAPKPIFIWEPVPDLCTPDELLNTTNALPYIDICSPNHHELASLMGDPLLGLTSDGEIDCEAVERACEQLLGSMPLQSYTLIIRAGHKGCYVAKNGGRSRRPSVKRKRRPANHARGGLTPETDMEALFRGLMGGAGDEEEGIEFERSVVEVDPGIGEWLPAFHGLDSSVEPFLKEAEVKPDDNPLQLPNSPPHHHPKSRVIDPTGGGNAFLGGLSIGLARGKEILEATAWGSVAASFAIEQVGMPVLKIDDLGVETWNGVEVEERMGVYMKKWKGT
ncbi:pfkB family carbohydrate kinase-like protein [Halenospora varia]|nr:pfkB family carbohydrate kinase-like protein [Halenospora varia]